MLTFLTHIIVERTMKDFFKATVYIFLLVAPVIFVKENFEDYLKDGTSYAITQEPLSLDDLPTVTLCWRITKYIKWSVYEKDVTIDAKVFENQEKTVTLSLNQSVQSLYGIEMSLSELHLTEDSSLNHQCHYIDGPLRQCFKITSKWRGSEIINFQRLTVEFTVRFSSAPPSFLDPVIISSEENAYGLAGGRWFDGNIQCSYLKPFEVLKIIEITEYINLDSRCTKDSFYACLARRFLELDFRTISRRKVNGTVCSFSALCSPFTLPPHYGQIPICQNALEQICYGEVLNELKNNQEKFCKKACNVKEFEVTKERKGRREVPSNTQVFAYNFQLPISIKDHRSEKPFKIVKTEYLIMSWISLVANVGGTFGLFIGFSFLGLFEWALEVREYFWAKIKAFGPSLLTSSGPRLQNSIAD